MSAITSNYASGIWSVNNSPNDKVERVWCVRYFFSFPLEEPRESGPPLQSIYTIAADFHTLLKHKGNNGLPIR